MLDRLQRLYARLIADGSAEERAVRSGVWVTGINVGDRVLQLLSIVVLARLLSPAAFGLLGIALLTLAALEQFSKLGFDEALIQHRDENVDEYLNTVWVMKIVRGLLITTVAFVAAPYLAAFFGEPRTESLIRVIGLSPLLMGLQNPAVVYFRKNLEFHKEFAYKIGGRVMDVVVAVAFAFVYRNVWALAAGLLASRLTMLVLSYAIHEYRPRVSFDFEYGREMFGFGKWLFLSSILIFLYGQGDDAFVGWFFGASALGLYQIAYRFSNAPASEVTQVISQVAFPALSKVQDDIDRLREGYLRSVHLTTVVAFPMAAGIIAVAPQFVPTVLGTDWVAMVPLIQVLALWGAQRALGANFGPLFQAIDRPDISTKIQALKVAIVAVTIYPAADQFGVVGVAYVIVGNTLIVQPVAFYIALSVIEEKAIRILRLVVYPLLGSVLMGATVVSVDYYLLETTGILELLLLILVGVLGYGAVMFAIEKTSSYEVTGLYRDFVKHI